MPAHKIEKMFLPFQSGLREAVEFCSIARRQKQALRDRFWRVGSVQDLFRLLMRQGDPLPEFYGRGLVTQAYDNKFHVSTSKEWKLFRKTRTAASAAPIRTKPQMVR